MLIELNEIVVNKNKISYVYTRSPELADYFRDDSCFYIEYEKDIDFETVPKSIHAVPFATNLLPLSWLYDIEIIVDELDEKFYKSIEKIKEGFSLIYPDVVLKGAVHAKKIVNNSYEVSECTTCLFSGGVDATFTLLRHKEEKPTLFNVWGVDVDFDDVVGHSDVEKYCHKIASDFQVEYICIKSTVRTFLNEEYLNKTVYPILKDYWWHGAQHSIGLLSLLAPFNYFYKVKTNYIASSFTQEDFEAGVKSVTYPVVDNALKIASTSMWHDGFEYTRNDKLEYICNKTKEENLELDLKVCFQYVNGKNCNMCEKCYRTIIAILMFDTDIEKYGFKMRHRIERDIHRFLDCNEVALYNWLPIQEAYKHKGRVDKSLRWFLNYKFNNVSSWKSRISRKLSLYKQKRK